MLNITYKLVSQIENYERSLRNYNINKDRLQGYFKIDECGNYKSVIILNPIYIKYNSKVLFLLSLQNNYLYLIEQKKKKNEFICYNFLYKYKYL